MLAAMASWSSFSSAAPELASSIEARFGSHKFVLLATIRRDGSPRISGIEVTFAQGELWLGMMPGSRKSDDLDRDPRLALHSAPVDLALAEGDAKVNGRAVRITDPSALTVFEQVPDSGADVYRVDVTHIALTRVDGDWLVIDSWREGEEPQRRRRQ
jgi:pyridoxamine 5'-phosphate oxidase-like protein